MRRAAQITVTPASCNGPAYSITALILRSLIKYRIESILPVIGSILLELTDSELMSPIDVIIGADLFGMLVIDSVRKGSENESTVQNTTLGWILSGLIASSFVNGSTSVSAHHGEILEIPNFDLRRFWETEEIPQKSH